MGVSDFNGLMRNALRGNNANEEVSLERNNKGNENLDGRFND
jgi:hypothetical protein